MPPTPKDTKQSVYSELFPPVPSREQRRMVQIAEAAIRCYATNGIEKTTYERIAELAKVSRPLLQRYFADKEAIFNFAIKYIRTNLQQLVVEPLSSERESKEQLTGYVAAHFLWLKRFPQHAQVWKLFYFYCGRNAASRRLNTELVAMGRERIARLLREGQENGSFSRVDANVAAREVQWLITGALVTATTEDTGPIESQQEAALRAVLRLVSV